MGIYLKKFDTHTEYENYINGSGVILPNVSICEDTKDVHYNPFVDPYNGHEYVEIGGLKWATMNVGANSITDYGLYFQWGDVQGYTADQVGRGEGKKYFGWEDYKYCSGAGTSSSAMTKYNSTDGKTLLEASDDAAQANWGGAWRMPTNDNFQALSSATTNKWVSITVDNVTVSGRLFTDKYDTSKTLFFPAAGRCANGSVDNVGNHGYYWSSSLYTSSGVVSGRYLNFYIGDCDMLGYNRRYGLSVRPVAG